MRHSQETRDRAAHLFASGVARADVARRLGLARSTVWTWHLRWSQGGQDPRPGRRPRLDRRELRSLGAALLDGPVAHGYPLAEWSLASIAALIHARTGVRYHTRHVSRLVRRMGWLVPPFERTSAAALFSHPVADPSGNRLNLLVRPGYAPGLDP